MKPAIAYIGVFTLRQSLGLEAQQTILDRFAQAEGYTPVRTFQGKETGKGHDALERRPQLNAAMTAGGSVLVASWIG
jgi:DNA invertase Pin-like site-specific DNA recombinase